MLRISKLADYSIMILSLLATKPGESLSAADIASCTSIGLATVKKVLRLLNTEAKLLSATQGALGGYSLVDDPADIKLSHIIEAVEGRLAITECNTEQSQCDKQINCHLSEGWLKVNQIILKALDSITLAQMMQPKEEWQTIVFHPTSHRADVCRGQLHE